MAKGGYDHEFVSEVFKEYICCICELPMRKPVQTKCGHRFCRDCLLKANKRNFKRGQAECPMDRQPLSMEKEKLFDDKAVERYILSLIIKCPNSKCDWQGELGNLEDHKVKCDYWIINCTLCGVKKLVKEIEVHNQEECEWRKVPCPHCWKGIISRKLEKHNDVCPEFPVECPNQCSQIIARTKAEDHIVNHCSKSIVPCTYSEIGCEFECAREDLKNHLKNVAEDHLSLVLKHTQQFQEKMKKRCDLIQKSTSNFVDKKELRKINQELETQQRKYNTLTTDLQDMQYKYNTLTADLQDIEKQTQLLIENNNKIKSNIQSLERKRKHVWRFMVAMAIGIIATLAFTSRQIAETSTESTALKEGLTELKMKLKSKVIWTVNDVSVVKEFSTGKYGYKLRMRSLQSREGQFFSFEVALLRGEYDAILTWPFSKTIKVTLLDQNEDPNDRQNVEVVVDPKESRASDYLKRPTVSSSPPFGSKNIILEEHLNATNYFFGRSFFLLIEAENDLI